MGITGVLGQSTNYNGYTSSKYELQIQYYHPLNQWLLGATNGNQGQTVMTFEASSLSTTYNGLTAQNML